MHQATANRTSSVPAGGVKAPRGLMLLSFLIIALLPARGYPGRYGDLQQCPSLPNVRYVDAQATGGRDADGSSDRPFSTVIDGVLDIPTHKVVLIRPGTYSEALILNRVMELSDVVTFHRATASLSTCSRM